MLETKNSVAVITGGASGIGLSMAKYWAQNGGKVVLADIAEAPLKEAAESIDGEVATVVCNVTDETDCAKLASAAIENFGQINLVAPFAGIIKDGLTLATSRETGKVKRKMSLDQFKMVIDVNLNGVFLTIRECAE
jgi:3-oxoacyl-[acyl-carrier protein] reductase